MDLYSAGDSSQPAFSLFCFLSLICSLCTFCLRQFSKQVSCCSKNLPWVAQLLQIINLVFYFTYQSTHLHQISFLLSYESESCDSSPFFGESSTHLLSTLQKNPETSLPLLSTDANLARWDLVLKLPFLPLLGLFLLSQADPEIQESACLFICLCIFLTS